ncbi:hypothetical protein UFOVP891_45 [uncultured Caudovirales phage]|uniref:Uncharacterized protein n=1 Tax=uncultured Caudovirales phage TaxID=2100421 RepID=A0A6J5QB39_9CAUD|nr:hypothetical protein UFOVP472_22 [uncultured Caudovirales phage]CAB4169173.1 hypothetical protein UFOVP891_45 [uncultured Caudovirales phage]CAB4180762.1 hypothetical protein UFOVP1053_22 [uncultured Caudovirales phage]CAB4196019.1 hypothetical protein UFOVP1297_51 [uncultured Caudovirales phage]CAB4221893.1 hypothetical protein UFOVP1647_29 [uncultured Caudovirales phage]
MDAPQNGTTISHTNPALTRTGAETVHDTTVSLVFDIGGKKYTKTAITDGVTPTTDANSGATFDALANLYSCIFVWGINAAGTIVVAKGPAVLTADVTNASAALKFPPIPDTMCPFAYHTVAHANATAFQFGTSNWNATGVTLGTVIPVGQLPNRPLTS